MPTDLAELDFRRFWQRLQTMGLNAYEARSYLVLVGHPRFKALELAARAHVPRQKIYEVLDSLVEKGFAQVIQEKTKLFLAVPPDEAIPSYMSRRARALEQQLADQNWKAAAGMVKELMRRLRRRPGRTRVTLLIICASSTDPGQVASQFRKMCWPMLVKNIWNFSRLALCRRSSRCGKHDCPKARGRGVSCRLSGRTRHAGRPA